MSFVRQIKQAVGVTESTNTFECQDCGHTFESGREEAGYWIDCDECHSEDIERID